MIDHCKRVCRPLTRAEALTTAASPRLSPAHGRRSADLNGGRVKGDRGHNLPALTGLSWATIMHVFVGAVREPPLQPLAGGAQFGRLDTPPLRFFLPVA
jgi:hypothetical protein